MRRFAWSHSTSNCILYFRITEIGSYCISYTIWRLWSEFHYRDEHGTCLLIVFNRFLLCIMNLDMQCNFFWQILNSFRFLALELRLEMRHCVRNRQIQSNCHQQFSSDFVELLKYWRQSMQHLELFRSSNWERECVWEDHHVSIRETTKWILCMKQRENNQIEFSIVCSDWWILLWMWSRNCSYWNRTLFVDSSFQGFFNTAKWIQSFESTSRSGFIDST